MVMLAVEINYFTYQWVASVTAGAFRHASTATSRRETRSLNTKFGMCVGIWRALSHMSGDSCMASEGWFCQGLRHRQPQQHQGSGCNCRQRQERRVVASLLHHETGQAATERRAEAEYGGEGAQADVEAPGALGQVFDDH